MKSLLLTHPFGRPALRNGFRAAVLFSIPLYLLAGSVYPVGAQSAPTYAAPAPNMPPAATPSATPAPAPTPTPIPLATLPGAPNGLSLEESISIAVHLQGDVGSAEQSYLSAKAGITSARSAYFPNVTANIDTSLSNNPTIITTTSNNAGGFSQFTTNQTTTTTTSGVNVTANIFDSGLTKANVAGAKARALDAVGGVGSARSAIAYAVAQAFYEQLRESKLVAQSEGQLALAKVQLDEIQAQVEAGTAAVSDVQSVQVTVSQAQLNLSTARTALRVAVTNFRASLGLDRGPALKLLESPEVVALSPPVTTPANLNTKIAPAAVEPALPIAVATPLPLPTVPEISRLDAYIAEAHRLRPDLLQARSNVQGNEAALQLAKIASRPQVTATAGYNVDPRDTGDRGFQIGAGLTIPIFDAGGHRADVRGAEATLAASNIQLDQLQKTVDADVESTFVDIAGSVDSVSNARDLVEAARVNLATSIGKYQAGVGIVLDIINAQTQLFTAETSATQAVYDYELARANLDRAVGRFAWANPNQAPPLNAPTTLIVAPVTNKK